MPPEEYEARKRLPAMPKPSHREQLLKAGFKVVLERGYCGASVRDIVHAAGAPQGSFTNHFASKDAFCLELLNR
jgi:TetR/AcrR family transcriptional repressor of nem operon